ncbi:PaREP1 family protein [Vulcanisaeta thermophila]|uniref:PaREP1 family protein n=1 Tax=Vulcanisaeta thermophila TaxID=867917 RepID=UPI000AD05B8E
MSSFAPPRRDLKGYVSIRLREAESEGQLALKFLDQGLYRNAAGKAFQGWKALLTAIVALNRDLMMTRFPGVVRDKLNKPRARADVIIAMMPTSRLREVDSALIDKYGWELLYLTELALSLQEFQYNGLDREGLVSRYADLHDVDRDIRHLVSKTLDWVKRLSTNPSEAC